MTPEKLASLIALTFDGEYDDGHEVSISAHVDSNPSTVWIETTDDDGTATEFRITVEQQP